MVSLANFKYLNYLIGLVITVIVEFIMIFFITKRSKRVTPVITSFKFTILCMTLWCIGLIVQIFVINYTTINPMYIDYFIYLPVVLTPVALFFVAITYASYDKFVFKKSYILLFVIPIITMIVLWTNDLHGLFYEVYSTEPTNTVFGAYFYVHSAYTYGLFIVDIFILLKNSIKTAGAFAMPSILISLGALVPIAINLLGMTIFNMNIYVTPISFMVSIILIAVAILKYNFLDIAPIALKRIVNQMSDLYLVLSRDYIISDCNKPFERVFGVSRDSIIGKKFSDLSISKQIVIKQKNLGNYLEKASSDDKTYKIDASLKDGSKFFNIECSGIFTDNQCVGILILFKDITQHVHDMETLKQNQNTLMERERLATLGQMVGGIAHNLKTPIMSIAGAMEGLQDLITEYDKSIDDPDVTKADHHAIAHDMSEWISKVNSYDSYMSDIITAVKGQAVNMNDDTPTVFAIDELLDRVTILMKHELKNAFVSLNIIKKINGSTSLIGNINSLVQVVNNLISNAIQSYESSNGGTIDLVIDNKGSNVIISVIDHGCGIPVDVQKKLFNEMITTKGHNGTGLGLFMSYSTIKGHFNGDMNFTSTPNVGTTFNIILPQTKKINN